MMAIGTTAALIGGSVASSAIGASSANKAADAQAASGQAQVDLQRELYEDQKELFQPFYDDGRQYAQVRNYLDGIGPKPTFGGTAPQIVENVIPATGPVANPNSENPLWDMMTSQGTSTPGRTEYVVGGHTFGDREAAQAWADANRTGGQEYGGMQATDAYKFRVSEGVNAIDAGAAARGGLYSGKAMQDLQTYGQGQAAQFENDYYNRIAGGAAQGQAAAGQTAQAGQNYATGASNALANIGNAQSAGAIGVGNALQGGLNNSIGLWQYQNNMNSQPAATGGGSWWGG